MKAPARETASGYISSLFTYINEPDANGEREWEEIDVELQGRRPDERLAVTRRAGAARGAGAESGRVTADRGVEPVGRSGIVFAPMYVPSS